MKPPAEMTREELVDEVTYLRELAYGEMRDHDIDTLRRRLRVSPHEARVLLCLYRSCRAVSKELIDLHLPLTGGHERSTQTNNVPVHVSRLRAKLGRGAIVTSGASHLYLGYRMTDAGRQVVADALG
jgi:DNA-binding response OmpR family regulator